MKNIQTISNYLQSVTATAFRWLNSLCNVMHNDVDYINEPKQGRSWSGYNIT